jgi:hypothetical protein
MNNENCSFDFILTASMLHPAAIISGPGYNSPVRA